MSQSLQQERSRGRSERNLSSQNQKAPRENLESTPPSPISQMGQVRPSEGRDLPQIGSRSRRWVWVSFPQVQGRSALPLQTKLGAWKGLLSLGLVGGVGWWFVAEVREVRALPQRSKYVNNQRILPWSSLTKGQARPCPEAPPVIWGRS